MKDHNMKLYNMIFPIWAFKLFPPFLLLTMPFNFAIDSLVLILSLKVLKIADTKELYKRTILKVFLFGYLADFIGTIILMMVGNIRQYRDVLRPLDYEPASTPLTFMIMSLVIFIAGLFIYIFNRYMTLKKVDMTITEKKKLALALAVFTAPYTYMLSYSLIESIFGIAL